MSVERFERMGELVVHGGELYGRPDAVEFRARSNQVLVDWLVEATVEIDRWGTRYGVAALLHDVAGSWRAVATALPYDALYVIGRTAVRLVFSEYVQLDPGRRYRLFLADAVVVSPLLRLAAQSRAPRPSRARRAWA